MLLLEVEKIEYFYLVNGTKDLFYLKKLYILYLLISIDPYFYEISIVFD